jgi:hypothetical protein
MQKVALSLAVLLLLKTLPVLAQVPANQLPLRIGADQVGKNAFRGEIAAVRLYAGALPAVEIKRLAEAQPESQGKLPGIIGQWLRPRLPVVSGEKFDFSHGATVEAWIRPDAGMGGRIMDKITPGGSDGFLLDTHPGNALRLIVGNETLTRPLPHSDGWTHVAATVDDHGLLALFANGVRVAGTAIESDGVAVKGAIEEPGKPLTLWYRRPARRWT